ncbi:hypothetical protein KIW84_060387 [Lathyrus oleraceus]|uniref:Uncharacterized protein n=1 Tax=Pisum sativum TaxID=3888 RepID=A0A9D5A2R6_PEA|nr:hypothetical protein KIW84_060387 [Pisum sativum]
MIDYMEAEPEWWYQNSREEVEDENQSSGDDIGSLATTQSRRIQLPVARVVYPFIAESFIKSSLKEDFMEDQESNMKDIQNMVKSSQVLASPMVHSSSGNTFALKLLIKLQENNFLPWYQQMKARAHQFHVELRMINKGNKDISEYEIRIRAIVDSLLVVSDPISERDQVDVIL